MYIDNILAVLSFFIMVGGASELILYFSKKDSFSFKTSLIIKRIAKIVAYLFFTVLIFLTTFFKIKYLGTALCIYTYSIALFLYTLMDVLYSQVKKDDYISVLQNQLLRDDGFDDLFEIIKYTNAEYKIIKQDERQIYGIVKTEDYGACIGHSYKKILYKPKTLLSDKYLQFYAQYFEIFGFRIPVFTNVAEFEEYITWFQFIKPSRAYFWMKKNEKKMKLILLIILISLFLCFVVLSILQYYHVFNLDGWLSKEIN